MFASSRYNDPMLSAQIPQLRLTTSEVLGPIDIAQPWGFTSLNQAINTLVPAVYFFAALAALFYLLIGAVKYILSGSDDTKLRGARMTMVNAIVGLILLGLVMVIFQVIASAIPGLEQLFSR
jgi:hypothetical protein